MSASKAAIAMRSALGHAVGALWSQDCGRKQAAVEPRLQAEAGSCGENRIGILVNGTHAGKGDGTHAGKGDGTHAGKGDC